MEKEIEIKMSAIKDVIIRQKSECRKNVFEAIGILKNKYPDYAGSIQIRFDEICKDCGVDFYAEVRVNSDEINKHLEENVKIV